MEQAVGCGIIYAVTPTVTRSQVSEEAVQRCTTRREVSGGAPVGPRLAVTMRSAFDLAW